ncbi:MAG: tRNA 2-selenouridine(34) synthase MnmH [Pseudomonadales bacterium]|jgi:tRNA 2-selenouridine synthase|nr:tRNA 2-selenouridine(34) synthase MnmH [Pseudomonadales bacterium]
MRADTDDYRTLFLANVPLLDTRAPIEFARGSFPGAINLPLMNDAERAAVGTCYKQQGQNAAIALGHSLVNGEIKTQRVAAWLAFAHTHPSGYLYCFRGGLRSQICQQWMQEAGCHYPRVRGGYKALRRFLLQTLETLYAQQPLLVLGGRTGCAKTTLLQRMPAAIDLEGLAHHRGSAFGKRVGGQPAQIDFENALAIAMLRTTTAQPTRALLLEDESKLIGRIVLPPRLRLAMKASPLVLLDAPLEARVTHSFRHYILHNLHDWQAALGASAGFAAFADELRQSLRNIQRRLGNDAYAALHTLLERALAAHAAGNADPHRDWIAALLTGYYDPMYDYQLRKNTERIVFRGDADAVGEFIAQYCPTHSNTDQLKEP